MVSMVMLTALVIPHHHHGDRLCLKQNREMTSGTDCGDNHSTDEGHDDYCKISCVTHFVVDKVDCNQGLLPDYSFITLVYDLVNSVLMPEDGAAKQRHEIYYLDKLYPQCLVAECGLRAPPYTIFPY